MLGASWIKAVVATAAAVGVVATGSFAYAQSTQGLQVKARYKTADGAANRDEVHGRRAVDLVGRCRSGRPGGCERRLGLPGRDGAVAVGASLDLEEATASCPAGKRPIGGGASSAGALLLIDSVPAASQANGSTGWTITMVNLADDPVQFTVYAVCASV